jgi:periplasmic protein CpxP/Spy
MMFKSTKPAIFGTAAAAVLGILALSAPLSPAAAGASGEPASHKAAGQNPEATVEDHIAGLKQKLKITGAEEAQWDAVADVMRENAKDEQARIDQRNAGGEATAIDDLKSYVAMAQGHADGLKKMETAFEALYNVMPDDQKKNADQVFAEHEGRGAHAKKKTS